MISDLFDEVKFASYFSCMDMIEALNGTVGDTASYLDYGYFGVLGAEFDAEGRSTGTYSPKPSYRALQVIAAVFREDFALTELPIHFRGGSYSWRAMANEDNAKDVLYGGFRRPDGSSAFVYWKPVSVLTSSYESTITIEVASLPGEIRLVDMLDGSVYTLPEKMVEDNGHGWRILRNIPIKDSPLMLTFGDFIYEIKG